MREKFLKKENISIIKLRKHKEGRVISKQNFSIRTPIIGDLSTFEYMDARTRMREHKECGQLLDIANHVLVKPPYQRVF